MDNDQSRLAKMNFFLHLGLCIVEGVLEVGPVVLLLRVTESTRLLFVGFLHPLAEIQGEKEQHEPKNITTTLLAK